MKKIISVFSFVFALLFLIQMTALAAQPSNDSIQGNNCAGASMSFSISTNGQADVDVYYCGINNVTSGATIDVVIKKNTFLFFWSTVVDESYNISQVTYYDMYSYDLSSNGSGTYKCFVTYTISGSGGADDVIPFEDTASY